MAEELLIDTELLISLVENRPVLWDKHFELYKNRVHTQTAWNEIMMAIDPEFEARDKSAKLVNTKLVIQRWTHIRDNYFRSRKRILNQKRAGVNKTSRPYVYNKHLSFLQKILRDRRSENSTDKRSSIVIEDLTQYNTNSDSESSIEFNDKVTKKPTLKRTLERPVQNNDNDSIDTKMMRVMDSYLNNKPKTSNRHLSFFNSILPTLDTFNDDEILEFQMGVLHLLKKIKNSRHHPAPFESPSGSRYTEEYQDNMAANPANTISTTSRQYQNNKKVKQNKLMTEEFLDDVL